MIAQRFFSRPTSVWLTLAALAIGSASANAQATKTAPTTKLQEKAKAKKAEEKAAALVDVNSASAAEMEEKLPGVGPAVAKAIVDGRPYKNLAALGKVKGIGEAKLANLKGLVSFEKPAAATPKATAAKADTPKEKMEKAEAKTKVAAKEKEEEPPTTKPKVVLADGKKVNINKATAEDLDSLFGIGEVRAKAIIAGRPYEKIEDIMKVKGIKEGTFEKIKDAITVK